MSRYVRKVWMLSIDETLREEFDRLRGRLAGLIEAFGLEERQERAAISTLKSLSYDAQERIGDVCRALLTSAFNEVPDITRNSCKCNCGLCFTKKDDGGKDAP